MRKTLLAFAAIAAIGFTATAAAPAFAQSANIVVSAGERHDGARSHRSHRRVVVVKHRRDNGLHRGWYKHRAEGRHVTVIKRRGYEGGSKKVIIRRD